MLKGEFAFAFVLAITCVRGYPTAVGPLSKSRQLSRQNLRSSVPHSVKLSDVAMSKSLKKAEETAYNGTNQAFDTQLCTDLQNEILSSSPKLHSDEESASSTKIIRADIVTENTVVESAESSLVAIRLEPTDEEARNKDNLEQVCTLSVEGVDDDNSSPRVIKPNCNGRSRPSSEGKEHRPADFNERYHRELGHLLGKQKMDEFSQLSSLSPTQPNSESCYRQYYQKRSADQSGSIREENSQQNVDENYAQKGPEATKHHSVVTDSTAYTYRENDTGHVDLSVAAPENLESDENENRSQDVSLISREQGRSQPSYEPRTPAAVNPFSHKGSVMKEHEMFGATQPSSIGRHIISPTSSRPSPDIYNHFALQKTMTTSPLERHGNDTNLQSSVRKILRSKSTDSVRYADTSPPNSSRSFGHQPHRREPRDIYIPVKQSQERRQLEASSDSDPEPEDDFFAGLNTRTISRRDDQKIQRVLAQVTSSRSGSGAAGDVEVPASGGRSRSAQENYIAQYGGTDARDIQQEEVIIDSQGVVEEPEAVDAPQVTTSPADTEDAHFPRSSPPLPARRASTESHHEPELHPASLTEDASSPPKDAASPLQPASLSSQEISINHDHLKTPVASKAVQVLSDEADATFPSTILETSPLVEDCIRPMGEITSLSFTDNIYDDSAVDGVPGFTQDDEFHNAIITRSSPAPSRSSRIKVLPTFEPPVAATKIPNDGGETHVPQGVGSEDCSAKAVAPAEIQREDDNSGDEEKTEKPKPQLEGIEESDRAVVEPQNVESDSSIDAIAEFHHEEEVLAPQNFEEDAAINENATNPQNEEEKEEMTIALPGIGEDQASTPHNEESPILPQKRLDSHNEAVTKALRESIGKRDGLRTKAELKGPSRALRRASATADLSNQCPSQPTSGAKIYSGRSPKRVSDVSNVPSTPLSSLGSTPVLELTPALCTRSTTRKNATDPQVHKQTPSSTSKTRRAGAQTRFSKQETPVPAPKSRTSRRSTLQAIENGEAPASNPPTRSSKRKSIVMDDEEPGIARAPKRQATSRPIVESSEDPFAQSKTTLHGLSKTKKSTSLFSDMAFAVSYSKEDQEKSHVTSLITEQGGRLLEDGFEKLFEFPSLSRSHDTDDNDDANLALSPTAKSIGFIALISNEHSRKAKYMQALALGLPCISGRWILACIAKAEVVDWSPYLLCAGQSSFLGNAFRSRTLVPYSATEANFSDTLSSREKLLEGKSVLLITAKGKEDSRKAYVFLTRAMAPSRIKQVSDYAQARVKLLDDEEAWDLLYVDKNESAAEAAIFGTNATTNSGSRKRKRGTTALNDGAGPTPKRIRVINDEFIIQSLILGKLLEG